MKKFGYDNQMCDEKNCLINQFCDENKKLLIKHEWKQIKIILKNYGEFFL